MKPIYKTKSTSSQDVNKSLLFLKLSKKDNFIFFALNYSYNPRLVCEYPTYLDFCIVLFQDKNSQKLQ